MNKIPFLSLFLNSQILSTMLVLVLSSIVSANTWAHGGHDDRLKIRLIGSVLVVELQLESALLLKFDVDKDGLYTLRDHRLSAKNLARWVDDQVVLRNADNRTIQPVFADLPIENFDSLVDTDAIEYVKVIRRFNIEGLLDNYLQIGLFVEREKPKPYTYWDKISRTSGWLQVEEALLKVSPGFSILTVPNQLSM
jgi:hypothetical protein